MSRKCKNVVTIPENRHLYDIWKNIKNRCYNENLDRYKDYGKRGIQMCHEWYSDFDSFADWAKNNKYQIGLTIDRINNDGNYEPNNCRWITRKEQNQNKCTTLYVTYRGEEKTLTAWCQELNLSYDTVHNRIYHIGMSVDDAFEKPFVEKSFAQMCREHNINPRTARDRMVKLGWTLEQALTIPSTQRGCNRVIAPRNHEKINCQICGKVFTRKSLKHIYCSENCYKLSRRAAHKRLKANV